MMSSETQTAWMAEIARMACQQVAGGDPPGIDYLTGGYDETELVRAAYAALCLAVERGVAVEVVPAGPDVEGLVDRLERLARTHEALLYSGQKSEAAVVATDLDDARTALLSRITLSPGGDGRRPDGHGLTLRALREANVARQAEWCPDQVPDLSFRGNELGGECGEAQNVIKKLERERQGWRGSRATLDDLAQELADVVICADLCAVTAGIDLDAAVVAKFNATSEKQGLFTMLPRPEAASPVDDANSGGEAPVSIQCHCFGPYGPDTECDRCAGSGFFTEAAPTPAHESERARDPWQPISTAPTNIEVEVKVGLMTFRAMYLVGASLTEDELPCNQWQATREDEHPPCWTDGACWGSNADEVASRQPEAWRSIPYEASPRPSQEKSEGRDA